MVVKKQDVRNVDAKAVTRFLVSLVAPVATFFILKWSLGFIRDEASPKLLTMLVALAVGVLGIWVLYWIANDWVSRLPFGRLRESLLPFVFVGPAVLLLLVFMVYPTVNTIYLSLFEKRSDNFVGLDNYVYIFTEPDIRVAFQNNIKWLIVVTGACVSLGLAIAVLVDRVRMEGVAKAFIFLPMAISSAGASVIWRFIYAFQPVSRAQIGLLNAIVVAFDGEPRGWLLRPPVNSLALMAIMIWLQTGFCMVVMSAAIKGVPRELLEAGRMDGCNEFQLFFNVIVPYIRGNVITVTTTVLIAVLKVFDIVYVMTRGNYDTEVIANRMYVEMYRFLNFGHGSALAVVLFLAVIPAIVVNIRNLRRQRSGQ